MAKINLNQISIFSFSGCGYRFSQKNIICSREFTTSEFTRKCLGGFNVSESLQSLANLAQPQVVTLDVSPQRTFQFSIDLGQGCCVFPSCFRNQETLLCNWFTHLFLIWLNWCHGNFKRKAFLSILAFNCIKFGVFKYEKLVSSQVMLVNFSSRWLKDFRQPKSPKELAMNSNKVHRPSQVTS